MIDSRNPFQPLPEGRPPGVLPRKSRLGEWCPLASERIKIIPRDEWDAAAEQLGAALRNRVPVVLDQDGVGSCAAEATTGGLMLARSIAGKDFVLLNPWYMYRVTSGGVDGGSSIDSNLVFARDIGIAPEKLHPRSLGWRASPSREAVEAAKQYRIEEFYDIANINEFVSALLQGFPVVFGSNGHAILAVQHKGSYPLILNSWSRSWGDGGFGQWCSYNAINWGYGAFAIRVAS